MASVIIGDGLMTTDGHLHASQMAVAVFRNSTQQWHVVLACGTFTYHDTPPFTLQWTTPSGQSVSSSQYKEGQFLLLLDNPVSGGSYTCRVPDSSASVACLHGNSTDVSSTVVVDDVKSRLTLLEAENRQVHADNRQLHADNRQLKEEQNQTNARIDSVSTLLSQHLHDERTKRVSFLATNLKDNTPSFHDVLILTTVHNNQGNGYNPATGKFTAPYNGTYCFMSSLCGYGSGHVISVFLMVDGKTELFVDTQFGSAVDYDAASLQAVVSVRAGQSVWLQVNGDINQFYSYSYSNSFSGFLVSYDL
ncbi:caprin-2-like [Littorina saxatilis]|uniref:caprin-2-like n=1 Tax=Littorina saxatilis TaxID=31220 RepID=UPI0038B4C6B9